MQLKYEVQNDSLLVYMLVGPGETYNPEDHKNVLELHKRVKTLETKIKKMREEIDPELIEVKKQVEAINASLTSNAEEEKTEGET